VERLGYLKEQAKKFFQKGNLVKAKKLYTAVTNTFKNSDAKKNHCKEEEDTTMYRDATEALNEVILLTKI